MSTGAPRSRETFDTWLWGIAATISVDSSLPIATSSAPDFWNDPSRSSSRNPITSPARADRTWSVETYSRTSAARVRKPFARAASRACSSMRRSRPNLSARDSDRLASVRSWAARASSSGFERRKRTSPFSTCWPSLTRISSTKPGHFTRDSIQLGKADQPRCRRRGKKRGKEHYQDESENQRRPPPSPR